MPFTVRLSNLPSAMLAVDPQTRWKVMNAVITPKADADSGHWYARDGRPCYTVPNKSGGERGINLRWDRHLKLVPSVTTVTQVISKPALENWKVDQAILSALTLPREADEPEAAYIARVKLDSKQQALQAAAEGTRIHRAIEDQFAGRSYPVAYVPHVAAVLAELERLFPDVHDWISEKTFAHPLGYGGAVDLHSPSTGIVVDYKGRDGNFTETDAYGKPKKLAWDQHWQLAAYQVGLGLIDNRPTDSGPGMVICEHLKILPRCAKIFVSRTHPGKVASHIWSADDIASGWAVFEAALVLWKRLRGYDGSF